MHLHNSARSERAIKRVLAQDPVHPRAALTFQSADANLVRLGDIGASSLYAQYSDYHSVGLDLGYRRYLPLAKRDLRVYGEATINSLPAFLRLYDTPEGPLDVDWLRHAMDRHPFSTWEDSWVRHRQAAASRPQGGIAVLYGVLSWIDLYNFGRLEANRLDDYVARRASHALGRRGRRGGRGGGVVR